MYPIQISFELVLWIMPAAMAVMMTGEMVKDWKDKNVSRWDWTALSLIVLAWDVSTVLAYLGVKPFCIL